MSSNFDTSRKQSSTPAAKIVFAPPGRPKTSDTKPPKKTSQDAYEMTQEGSSKAGRSKKAQGKQPEQRTNNAPTTRSPSPPPVTTRSPSPPDDEEQQRKRAILSRYGVPSELVDGVILQLEGSPNTPPVSVKTVLAPPKGLRPLAKVATRMAAAASTGAGTFLLAESPLAKSASPKSFALGTAGALVSSFPLYSDTLSFLGGEVHSWNKLALDVSNLRSADHDHHAHIYEAIELQVKILESISGALVNGVLGSVISQDWLAAAVAVGGGIGSAAGSLLINKLGETYVKGLSTKKVQADGNETDYDLASLEKAVRKTSKAALDQRDRLLKAGSLAPILLGIAAGLGGIVAAGLHKHSELDGSEFSQHYVGERLVPAGINFLAMSAYLIGLAKSYAAQPKAKAALEATMLRKERKDYEKELKNNSLPTEEAVLDDDGARNLYADEEEDNGTDSLRELLARADGGHPLTTQEMQRVNDHLDANANTTPAVPVRRTTERPQDQTNSPN